MSILGFMSQVFTPAADLVDELITSDEERLKIQAKLAQIEAKVSVKLLDLQTKVVEAQADVAKSEQQYGNALSRSWRPIVSVAMAGTLMAMGFGFIPFNDLLAQIAGGFLGIYGIGRTLEKRK